MMPQLTRLCRLWQRRLRLQDWEVTPALAPEAEMPDSVGEIVPETGEMKAALRVREDADIEATLVHELLHLRLWPYSDGDPSEPHHDEREQAINLLADCFLRAYPRRTKRGARPEGCNGEDPR